MAESSSGRFDFKEFPLWADFLTNDPIVDFRKGSYTGVFVEIGAGVSPVSYRLAQRRPDLFVLAIDKSLIVQDLIELSNYTALDSHPPNWKYLRKQIEKVELPDDIPLVGLTCFFPSQRRDFGEAVADFIIRNQINGPFGSLIVTETEFNGAWRGFVKGFEGKIKSSTLKEYWQEPDRISFSTYHKIFPKTYFSNKLEQESITNSKPAGVLMVKVLPSV